MSKDELIKLCDEVIADMCHFAKDLERTLHAKEQELTKTEAENEVLREQNFAMNKTLALKSVSADSLEQPHADKVVETVTTSDAGALIHPAWRSGKDEEPSNDKALNYIECRHGTLQRKCEICELERENAELRERLKDHVVHLEPGTPGTATEELLKLCIDHIAAHSCVSSCCGAQPSAGEAKQLAECLRRRFSDLPEATHTCEELHEKLELCEQTIQALRRALAACKPGCRSNTRRALDSRIPRDAHTAGGDR